jgi:hypothetical protein
VIPLLCPQQQPHWVLCEPRHHICGVDRLHRIFDGQIRRGSEEQDWYTLNAKDLVSWRWTRNGRPTEAFRHFSIAQIIRGWIYLKEVGYHCQCKCRQDMVNCHDQKAVDAGRECAADLEYNCIKHSLCNIVVVISKRCMVHFRNVGKYQSTGQYSIMHEHGFRAELERQEPRTADQYTTEPYLTKNGPDSSRFLMTE